MHPVHQFTKPHHIFEVEPVELSAVLINSIPMLSLSLYSGIAAPPEDKNDSGLLSTHQMPSFKVVL